MFYVKVFELDIFMFNILCNEMVCIYSFFFIYWSINIFRGWNILNVFVVSWISYIFNIFYFVNEIFNKL